MDSKLPIRINSNIPSHVAGVGTCARGELLASGAVLLSSKQNDVSQSRDEGREGCKCWYGLEAVVLVQEIAPLFSIAQSRSKSLAQQERSNMSTKSCTITSPNLILTSSFLARASASHALQNSSMKKIFVSQASTSFYLLDFAR
jgi:hypothetical protein